MDHTSRNYYVSLKRPSVIDSSQGPRDSYHGIYFAMVLAGIGILLPYNSFIIAVDYFQGRFPGTPIVFDMSFVYIIVSLGAVVINNLFVECLSLKVRISFGYAIAFATLLFVTICEIGLEVFDSHVAYSINLAAIAVVAVGCTIQQSSLYGFTSLLPQRYTQAVMTGESAAGFLISINRIITKSLLHDAKVNTLIFFVLSLAIVAGCAILHHIVQKSAFVHYYLTERQHSVPPAIIPTRDEDLAGILEPEPPPSHAYGVLQLQSSQDNDGEETNESENEVDSLAKTTTFRVANVGYRKPRLRLKLWACWGAIKRGINARMQIARTIWPYMLSLGVAYCVTLCLFPGLESEIPSCKFGSWMPVILMAVFNASDLLGKILASLPWRWTRLQLVMGSLSRIFFIPLLLICAAPRASPVLAHESWPLLFSALLGLTNGVFGSLPIILAPSKVSDHLRELTGNIMTLSYSIGLTSGALLAYWLDRLLGPESSNLCSALGNASSNLTETVTKL